MRNIIKRIKAIQAARSKSTVNSKRRNPPPLLVFENGDGRYIDASGRVYTEEELNALYAEWHCGEYTFTVLVEE